MEESLRDILEDKVRTLLKVIGKDDYDYDYITSSILDLMKSLAIAEELDI